MATTLSFPKSSFRDPWISEIRKIRIERGCDDDSKECVWYRGAPHRHLVMTGYYVPPEIREALKVLWAELHPLEEPPTDDDINSVIASRAPVLEAGPWRCFHEGSDI
jgi:hypothetical protein